MLKNPSSTYREGTAAGKKKYGEKQLVILF